MLRAFRNSFHDLKWALWLVIIAFVIGLGYVGGAGPQTSASAVASVGGVDIPLREFQRQYEELENRARGMWGDAYTAELSQQLGLGDQALQQVINAEILRQEADRMGLEATDEEIQRIILADPAFQDANGNFIGAEAYERELKNYRLTPAEWETDLRRRIKNQKLFQVLGQTLFVSDSEVEKAFRDQTERAAMRYVSVPKENFADRVVVDEEELRPFYEGHRSNYNLPEQRRVDYVLIQPRLLESTMDLPDEEIRSYYDSYPEEFTVEEQVRARHILLKASGAEELAAARARLEDIRRRVEAGEDFGTVARQVSQDDATRELGGELGFFSRGRYNPTLEDAAFSGTPGTLVGPVETDLITQTGLHLVQIQERREGGVQDFETVSPGIRARLLSERSAIRAEELANELSGEGDQSAQALQAWAEAESGATWETPAAFGREDNVPGIGRGTEFTTTAFELESGKVSEPIAVTGGWAVLRLAEVSESRIQEFEEVVDRVREDVRGEKLGEVATRELEALRLEIEAGLEAEEAAARLGVEFTETEEFNRTGFIAGIGREPDLSQAAFERVEGQWGGPVETTSGHVLFQITSRTPFDPVSFEEQKEETRDRLVQERTEEMLSATVQQRREELGVKPNNSLLQEIGILSSAASS